MRFSLASLLVECCCAGILPSEKRQCLRWCSGRWCQVWQGGGVLFLFLKMSQNSMDDILLLKTADDLCCPAAAGADLDVYIEYALEPLSPGHCRMSLRCRADLRNVLTMKLPLKLLLGLWTPNLARPEEIAWTC